MQRHFRRVEGDRGVWATLYRKGRFLGKMRLSDRVSRYIEGLELSQGRYAGQPFVLANWERRFLRGAFRQPGDAALSLARGGGKTTFIAAVACAAVDADGPLVEPNAETLIVASAFTQGRLSSFKAMLRFLQPTFEKYGEGHGAKCRFRVNDSDNAAMILDKLTGAMVRVLGCDPRRMHGAAPKLLLLDELAQWPRTKLPASLAALKTSRGKIPGSRAFWIGTRPETAEHPFQKALDGLGMGYAQVHAATEADERNKRLFWRRTWKKANPGLDHLPDLEAVIREEAETARRDPEALQSFKSLRLNMGVPDSVQSMLLQPEAWERALALPAPAKRSRRYVLGVDLGSTSAMSAASGYFRDGRLLSLACFSEIPGIEERAVRDGVGTLYRTMVKRGELFQAGRRVNDPGQLLRRCLRLWGRPEAIVCDRFRVNELRDILDRERFPRAELVIRGMGWRDGSADVRGFRAAVLSDRVIPERSVLMASAISKARTMGDPAGNWKLAKWTQGGRNARSRDDAAASGLLAVAEGNRRWHVRRAGVSSRRRIRTAIA